MRASSETDSLWRLFAVYVRAIVGPSSQADSFLGSYNGGGPAGVIDLFLPMAINTNTTTYYNIPVHTCQPREKFWRDNIAVNMDRKKCGTFSSFRWLSADIYHINILRNPNEVDVHWGRSAKPKYTYFWIKNSWETVSFTFSQSLFEQNVSYSENYCDFQRFLLFRNKVRNAGRSGKNAGMREISQNAGFPARLRDGWHLWDKRGATERSEPTPEGGSGGAPRTFSKSYIANGAIYVIPELYLWI